MQAVQRHVFGDLAEAFEGGEGRFRQAAGALQLGPCEVGEEDAFDGAKQLGNVQALLDVVLGGVQLIQAVAGHGQRGLGQDGRLLGQEWRAGNLPEGGDQVPLRLVQVALNVETEAAQGIQERPWPGALQLGQDTLAVMHHVAGPHRMAGLEQCHSGQGVEHQ
ncbi:hypothetical protein D9M68_626830 [compost metagenome]